jgi:hypothetical protein
MKSGRRGGFGHRVEPKFTDRTYQTLRLHSNALTNDTRRPKESILLLALDPQIFVPGQVTGCNMSFPVQLLDGKGEGRRIPYPYF